MTIITFLIILAVLIFVHELGHFIVAKRAGIRVDEFSIGFPPRLFSWKRGETLYSLNLIPFGGYVKIFGEDPSEESISGPDSGRSFVNRPKWVQALVLAAGVAGNIIFAWLLISLGFATGLPTSAVNYEGPGTVLDAKLLITHVEKGAPGENAGLKDGDEIVSITASDGSTTKEPSVEMVRDIINDSKGKEISLSLRHGSEAERRVALLPKVGLVEDRFAVGIMMDMVGTLRLPIHQALMYGALRTANLTVDITKGLYHFFVDAFRLKADLSQISGPVGIAGLVGEASRLGFSYLLTITVIISINLAVINLMPFPALDGGRILFVCIEAISGRAIPPNVANTLNAVGFALLILLMIVITYRDVVRLVAG